jgi:hypothetical protein
MNTKTIIITIALLSVITLVTNVYTIQSVSAKVQEDTVYLEREQSYKCGDCTIFYRATDFIVYEHPDSSRTIAVDWPFNNNDVFVRELMHYEICYNGDTEPAPMWNCEK